MCIKRFVLLVIGLFFLINLSACEDVDNAVDPEKLSFEFDFSESKQGWTGDFADLPVDYEEDLYELKFAHKERPAEVNGDKKALMLSGQNASDDLFMYVKNQLTAEDGIKPDTTYKIRFEVEFATHAPAGAVGIGGPPGEAVWVKVGASPMEPVPVEENGNNPYYRMNVDKGIQNNDGEHALRIGDVSKPTCDDFDTYELKVLNNTEEPLEISSDNEGNLWIFVGTDSGFEGRTTLYYTAIRVSLEVLN